jgi:hypothetical protein
MNTTIFLTAVGSVLLLVGVVYSIKAWNTRPVLTPEQNAQRISDGFAPFTAPMLVSGIGVVAGLFVLAMALLPLALK